MSSDTLAIVVAYKNEYLTEKCVEGLLNQSHPVDVVVWDNDNSEILRNRHWTDAVSLHSNTTNFLWSPAINEAMHIYRQKRHKALCFLNNDIVIPPRAIELMWETFNEYPQAGIVGPLGSALGGEQDYAAHYGAWADHSSTSYRADDWITLQGSLAHWRTKRVAALVGACMFVRTKMWDEIGPLAQDMPLGAEDHDYCMRAKHADYWLMVNQNVYANHLGHATHDAPEWDDWGGKSWDVFNQRWAGYFKEDEPVHCQWGYTYVPGYDKGTGWTEEEYKTRILDHYKAYQ